MSKPGRQSPTPEPRAGGELTFEKALAEPETIVAQMEGGGLGLEQALATHKRGLELVRFCQQRLDAAQQQVKVLEGDILKPLAPSDTQAGERD